MRQVAGFVAAVSLLTAVMPAMAAAQGAPRRRTPARPAGEALGTKVGEYVPCLNEAAKAVSEARRHYLGIVERAQRKVLTSREYLGNLLGVDSSNCRQGVARAKRLPPALPELEAAAAGFIAALDTLEPILRSVTAYYGRAEDVDDGLARGKLLHAELAVALESFDSAERALRRPLEAAADRVQTEQLAVLEKKGPRWAFLATRLLVEAKQVMKAAAVEKPEDIDLAAFQALLARYQSAVDEYTTVATAAQAASPFADEFLQSANAFLLSAKELMRHKRDGTAYRDQDELPRFPERVSGHPAQVAKRYSELVHWANAMR